MPESNRFNNVATSRMSVTTASAMSRITRRYAWKQLSARFQQKVQAWSSGPIKAAKRPYNQSLHQSRSEPYPSFRKRPTIPPHAKLMGVGGMGTLFLAAFGSFRHLLCRMTTSYPISLVTTSATPLTFRIHYNHYHHH